MPAPAADSLIDALDERGHRIGSVTRGSALTVGANFRTVHVLVLDHAGRLLLQQLSPKRERHPLLWGSSVAGYVHAGETDVDAAHRRLREELGLVSEPEARGTTTLRDERSLKFVSVFETVADHPVIDAPEVIAQIRFSTVDDVLAEVATYPERFTATFRHVLSFWRGLQA